MTESAQKCENNEAIFKQNHKTLHLFLLLNWRFFAVSVDLWEKSRFSRFPPKKFETLTTVMVVR